MLFLGLMVAGGIVLKDRLWFNLTASLPQGFYLSSPLKDASSLKAGDLILFCPEKKLSEFSLSRGYLGKGNCTLGSTPLGKRIVAVSGDKVRIDAEGITVNGKLLKESRPLEQDAQGRILERATFNRPLQPQEFLVMGDTKDSFDSRYFGPVNLGYKNVQIRLLTPLLTQ